MPILAAPLVRETSVKTGLPLGNEPPTETAVDVPLTEIVALFGFPATGLAATGLAAPIETFVPVLGVAADCFFAPVGVAVVEGAAEEQPPESPAPESATQPEAICCLKGSLPMNLLKETSCPAFGGNGLLGSETPSADVEAVEPLLVTLVAAVDEPAREGGARGVAPAVVELVVDGLDEALRPWGFSIFIVRGTCADCNRARVTKRRLDLV